MPLPAQGQQALRLWACIVLLLAGVAAVKEPRTEVGTAACHPDCTDHGNCGEDGHCRCPFGRTGKACEIDFLRPCKQDANGQPSCGRDATKSCECFQRCHDWECMLDSEGYQVCQRPLAYLGERACYERDGVRMDDQFSKVPQPEEEGVTCYTSYDRGMPVNCSEAMTDFNDVTLPLSQCPNQCNNRGYCMRFADQPEDSPPACRCYRGFVGYECEVEENSCFLSCSGRGKCTDQFCHCEPPYFSIGCTRSQVYPANHSRPSPVNFKIYMYELSTQLAYDYAFQVGYIEHYHIYVAFQKFLSQFLVSPVRTEDPSEASLFFIPAFTFSYSSNTMSPQDHVALVVDHLRHTSPYWNRTEGRDHFLWLPGDRGACMLQGTAHQPIKVVHFGYHTTANNVGGIGHVGHPEYGCAHPLRDVVAVPHDVMDEEMVPWLAGMSVDDVVAGKKRLFFFAGGVRDDDPEYS